MSDFLGHLVARSLELAPAVQPRLASLFEPTAGTAVPGPGLDSIDSTDRVVSPSPAERGRAGEGVFGPPQEDPSPALPRADAREREPSLPPRREKAALMREEPIPPPVETAPPAGAPALAVVPPAAIRPVEARVEGPEARPADSPKSRREDPPALQPLLLPRIEIPRLPEPAPLQASTARNEAADPSRREAAGIRPAEPGRSPVSAPAAPGIVVQPRIERAAAPAPPPGTPEATAPTIHVTIGRIEVRATAPQAAAALARRASAPAVLTLDEYLRRRDGERR